MTSEVGEKDGRGSTRDSLFLLTMLHDSRGNELGSGKVRNLSATGMLVETDVVLSLGEALHFELRGIGPLTGCVARVDNKRFGIHFDRPIDPALARRPVTGQLSAPPKPIQKFHV